MSEQRTDTPLFFTEVAEGAKAIDLAELAGVPRERESPNPPVRIKSVTIQPK